MKPVAWECEVCTTRYATPELATACEAQAQTEPSVAVGDIVLCRGGFGWFSGDARWIQNPDVLQQKLARRGACPRGNGNCFGPCCTYRFYYVVTAIDKEPARSPYYPEAQVARHRWRYHLATKAMLHGYRTGYTFDHGHYAPSLVPRPPAFLAVDKLDLIGTRSTHLI